MMVALPTAVLEGLIQAAPAIMAGRGITMVETQVAAATAAEIPVAAVGETPAVAARGDGVGYMIAEWRRESGSEAGLVQRRLQG